MGAELDTTNPPGELIALVESRIATVREELADDPYLAEARSALSNRLYRSAIGALWNAVVDDLRNKVIHRSLDLFNTAINANPQIKKYDDFIEHQLSDDKLIEGAHKIGVIGLEASKILKHSKETRHWFSGHPKSSQPSPFKVLAMLDDCCKYVLCQPYPAKIINVDDYMSQMASGTFDRNRHAIEMALEQLPEEYNELLANKLYASYVHPASSSTLRSNIEFVVPVLWPFLTKALKIQIAKRVDTTIAGGDATATSFAFAFIKLADTTKYLTAKSRQYQLAPLVAQLCASLDNFSEENRIVGELKSFVTVMPPALVKDLVSGLTHTFVGRIGSSPFYNRTDFYADGAAALIPELFETFDDLFAEKFVEVVRESEILRARIRYPAKLNRLRRLGNILLNRISPSFADSKFLKQLVNPAHEAAFLQLLDTK